MTVDYWTVLRWHCHSDCDLSSVGQAEPEMALGSAIPYFMLQ
jgi:hypothetical protein